MTSSDASTPEPDESMGSPDHDLGGPTIDAAVENSEEGTQAEGDHTPSGEAESGESRGEQMVDVVDVDDDGALDEQ